MTVAIRALDRRTDRRAVESSSVSKRTGARSAVNVRAYERLGYSLCGVDRLYYGSYMPGEAAIYLAKPLR